MTEATAAPPRRLPGDLMIWVLIVSELAVFGAGLIAFLAVRLGDPAGFAAGQDQLHRVAAGINTAVLATAMRNLCDTVFSPSRRIAVPARTVRRAPPA